MFEFATGTGKEDRDFFYNEHPFANALVNARINDIIFQVNKEVKKLGHKSVNDYQGVIEIGLPFSPTLNPSTWYNTAYKLATSDAVNHFVGGAKGVIQIQNGKMQGTINNATSRNSLFFHLGENYNRKNGNKILSTIYQHVHFEAEVIIK